VRRAVRLVVESQPGWSVCAETGDGAAVVDLALAARPDIVVKDVTVSGETGISLTAGLKRAMPGVEVLIFTMDESEQSIAVRLAAGARGYLLKSETDAHLVTAIAALGAHRSFFSPTVSDLLLRSGTFQRSGRPAAFTERELDVVRLVCEGISNGEIASQLGLSVKTVETHRSAAMRKADVHTAGQLVRFAVRNHLVGEPREAGDDVSN
jgi:DNA-binding NarL/FixJ family response regulator